MAARVENMIGEELLLLAVLGGEEDRAAVDRELDRRALAGPPLKERRRRFDSKTRHTLVPAA